MGMCLHSIDTPGILYIPLFFLCTLLDGKAGMDLEIMGGEGSKGYQWLFTLFVHNSFCTESRSIHTTHSIFSMKLES
jgi:hypothetical protein